MNKKGDPMRYRNIFFLFFIVFSNTLFSQDFAAFENDEELIYETGDPIYLQRGARVAIFDKSEKDFVDTFNISYQLKAEYSERRSYSEIMVTYDNKLQIVKPSAILVYYHSIKRDNTLFQVDDPIFDSRGRPGVIDGILVSYERVLGRRSKHVVIRLNKQDGNVIMMMHGLDSITKRKQSF
jgi:hypothetical protein